MRWQSFWCSGDGAEIKIGFISMLHYEMAASAGGLSLLKVACNLTTNVGTVAKFILVRISLPSLKCDAMYLLHYEVATSAGGSSEVVWEPAWPRFCLMFSYHHRWASCLCRYFIVQKVHSVAFQTWQRYRHIWSSLPYPHLLWCCMQRKSLGLLVRQLTAHSWAA